MEISTDDDINHLFQDRFDLNTCPERSFFRTSALSNNYIRTLYNNSKIHIRQPSRAVSLFESKGHVGLLHLFLPVSIIESYRLHTNEKLANPGPGKTCCTIAFISKARNRAISFMPRKPDKFAIRFYCNVGTAGPYIHSMFDKGRGTDRHYRKLSDITTCTKFSVRY